VEYKEKQICETSLLKWEKIKKQSEVKTIQIKGE
jgi:hypothetical protein